MFDAAKMPLDVLSVLAAMPGSYLILLPDRQFTIVGASDDYLADTYLKRDEIIGRGIFDVLQANPASPEASGARNLTASLRRVMESRQEHRMPDQRNDVLNPTTLEWEQRLWKPLNKPVLDAEGKLQYIIHWVEDITRRADLEQEARRAEEKLQRTNERLQKTLSIPTVGVIYFDLNGNIHDANEAFLGMSGYSLEDLQGGGVRWDQLTPPEFMAVTHTSREELLHTGQNTPYEKQYIRPDGSRWWGLFAGKRLSETEYVEFVLDVSQRKQAEAAVREKDERLRSIIHHAPMPMFIFRGEDMVIHTINKQALEMIGRTEAVAEKPLLEAVPELNGSPAYEVFREVYRTGITQYGREVLVPLERDGVPEDRYFNFTYTPLREDGQVVGVIDVATEVTEQVVARQKVEAAQKEAEKQKRLYEAITNNTLDLLYIFGLDYRFLYANEALLSMWGRTKEDALGRGLRELGYEEWHAAMHEREIDQVVATKKPVRGIVSFPHAELGKRVYDYLLVPVLNENGDVEAVAGTTRDITEIKQAEAVLEAKVQERTQELEELNRELKRSNQNLEEFAHAASHDLKEPVRKILFFTQQLKEQLHTRLSEAEHRSFNRIENATQRMGNLIDDLLLYSHVSQRPHQMEDVDLDKIIQHVLEDLELDIQEKEAVITHEHLPLVQGHRRQLQQLFQNLLSNAVKYSKPGVRPEIRITAEETTEHGQDYHLIRVSDNGIGFEQVYAEKIFQMFTRLHGRNEYSGTGVGLSIAKKVAENHEGSIQAESRPGQGTTFTVKLPSKRS